MPLALFGTPVGVPIVLGRVAARDAAHHELAKHAYRAARPGLLARLVSWLWDSLGAPIERAAGSTVGGVVGPVIILTLVAAAVIGLRVKLGPLGRAARAEQTLFLGRERTAAEHRAAADRHAARGEWADAVRERLRAVVRSLEERAILDPRPGRTADEAAAEAGASLPTCAAGLREAARHFDEVWYGGRAANSDTDARMRALDTQVSATRPTLATENSGPNGWPKRGTDSEPTSAPAGWSA